MGTVALRAGLLARRWPVGSGLPVLCRATIIRVVSLRQTARLGGTELTPAAKPADLYIQTIDNTDHPRARTRPRLATPPVGGRRFPCGASNSPRRDSSPTKNARMLEKRSHKLDVLALALLALCVFLTLALVTYNPADPPSTLVYPPHARLPTLAAARGAGGRAVLEAIGLGAYFLVISLAMLDAVLLARRQVTEPCFGWLVGAWPCSACQTLVGDVVPRGLAGAGDRAGRLSRGGRPGRAGNELRPHRRAGPDRQPDPRRPVALDRLPADPHGRLVRSGCRWRECCTSAGRSAGSIPKPRSRSPKSSETRADDIDNCEEAEDDADEPAVRIRGKRRADEGVLRRPQSDGGEAAAMRRRTSA